MDLGIRGRTALVFGAGGGLGGAIALALAREGARVAIADISADALMRTAEAIRREQGDCLSVHWDLTDLDRIVPALQEVQDAFGPVDILINNTGGPPPTPAAGQEPAQWQKFFNSMVLPVIAITDAVLPGMRERGWGRIVTSASSGVVAPIPNLAISNALRLGLVGWSKSLAREVAAQGITANIIVPGRIATARTQSLDQARARRETRDVDQVAAESAASIPAGRYGTPEEYGDAAAFLASARASYITGSVLRVDGGLIASI